MGRYHSWVTGWKIFLFGYGYMLRGNILRMHIITWCLFGCQFPSDKIVSATSIAGFLVHWDQFGCVGVLSYLFVFLCVFRPHRSTTYIDAAWCSRRSSVVCLSVMIVSPAEKQLNGSRCRLGCGLWWAQGTIIRWAHWRHLANTIEPFMCSSDVAFLSNYIDH